MSESPTTVIVREAVLADADALLAWRNDPVTRRMSLSTAPVLRADHLAWLRTALASPKRVILIGSDAGSGVLVGTCRFDVDADDPRTAEVSITVAPDQRGRGIAAGLLDASIVHFVAAHPHAESLTAVIRPGNEASIRLFEAARFVRTEHRGNGSASEVGVYELALNPG